ncbi:MAG TPA: hypothetical protein VMR06_14115 [Dokdonella sp.]|uniref:hypothetical protein n=1 Tax=Dokdonella sp. TaxID=2291710 RepID=UPI002CE442DD|nr:hypothetical protein [Dokdonella sp.]HUD43122.1 hypothetical protein [Dokdonella sp.]
MRKQRLEPGERQRRLAALTLALVLHGLFAIAAYRAAQLHRPDAAPAPRTADEVMHLRLIDAGPDPIAAPAVPAPPPSSATPMPYVSAPAAPRAAADDTAAAPLAADTGATPEPDRTDPAPRWIERDGTPRLPAPVAAPRTFSNRPLREAGAPDPLAHRSPLPYAPTRFEKDWAPRDETLGGQWLREHTVSRTVDLPQGYQVRCTWMLILGGCGWGKAPQATIEELRAMRADPPLPRSLAGPVDAVPAVPAPTTDPRAPARPLDLSLPPPLAVPTPAPGGR